MPRHACFSSFLGGIVNVHAWSLLGPPAQRLVMGARDGSNLRTPFEGQWGTVTLAEALLLVRAVGHRDESLLIAQQLPVPFVGDLRCFIQRETSKADKRLRKYLYGTTDSRAAFLVE